ncbi:MAG: NADH-quinone oxidoreductase subunit K [Elusimicrobia bacterium]|nr:NADH-quinone oxidoreductase subunit K [Elusimicrobiota bacterium]
MTLFDMNTFFKLSFVFIPLLFIIGFYCIIITHNLIRVLVGLELIIKAVTLLLVVVGYTTNHTVLMQSYIITLIIIEVVVIAVAAGIVVNVAKQTGSLDTRNLRTLKG